jgi:hypothetical protein
VHALHVDESRVGNVFISNAIIAGAPYIK